MGHTKRRCGKVFIAIMLFSEVYIQTFTFLSNCNCFNANIDCTVMILLQNIKVCGNLFRFLLPLVFVFTFVATRRLKNTNSVSRNAPNNTESTDVTSALKCRYNTTTTTISSDQHSVCLWNLISARFTSHAHSWMNGESSFMNGKPALAINAVKNCS